MDAVEVSSLLRKTARFLRTHLSLGSFEGTTGAQKAVVMRLGLATDLLLVAFQVKQKDGELTALSDLEHQVATNKQLKMEYQASLDDLVAWLFLNARGVAEEQAPAGLGQVAGHTPATRKVKEITEMVEAYLSKLGSGDKQEAATQVALASLVRVVKQLNYSLTSAAESGSIGVDAMMSLSRRTNDYFTKFVGGWLKSDSIARHFVFELGGFEFLLDTIGKKSEEPTSAEEADRPAQEAKQPATGMEIASSSALGASEPEPPAEDVTSDLYEILQTAEKDGGTGEAQSARSLADLLNREQSSSQEPRKDIVADEPPVLVLAELANKHLVLTDDNAGGHAASTHGKVDWSCNKRAYKNRLLTTALQGGLRNEYWILFKLQQTSLVREIQIGFTNYWTTDAEAHAEPLSVLVQAGLDRNNLTIVCSLDLVKDDGFGSVQATVFGKNLHSFTAPAGDVAQTVE